jgi:hypothetical protein
MMYLDTNQHFSLSFLNECGGRCSQSGQDLQRMNYTRNIPEAGEQDVDDKVAATTTLKEDADGW